MPEKFTVSLKKYDNSIWRILNQIIGMNVCSLQVMLRDTGNRVSASKPLQA